MSILETVQLAQLVDLFIFTLYFPIVGYDHHLQNQKEWVLNGIEYDVQMDQAIAFIEDEGYEDWDQQKYKEKYSAIWFQLLVEDELVDFIDITTSTLSSTDHLTSIV